MSTVRHPDVERFRKLVEADPTDWFQREVFADLLAEYGEVEEEMYQRWVARFKPKIVQSRPVPESHWLVSGVFEDIVFDNLNPANREYPLGSWENAWRRLRLAFTLSLKANWKPEEEYP